MQGYRPAEEQQIDELPSMVLDDYGVPRFIDGGFTDIMVTSQDDLFAVLGQVANIMGITNAQEEFRLIRKDQVGDKTCYRLQQIHDGIDVYGQTLIIEVDSQGQVLGLSGQYIPGIDTSTAAKLSTAEAEAVVIETLGAAAEIVSCEINVYANHQQSNLAYIIEASSPDGQDLMEQLVIDAGSGEVLSRCGLAVFAAYSYNGEAWDGSTQTIQLEEINPGSENQLRCVFRDPDRKITIRDASMLGDDGKGKLLLALTSASSPIEGIIQNGVFTYGNNSQKNQDTVKAAVSAMSAFEQVYDYYQNKLGRLSYDDQGSEIIANINFKENTLRPEEFRNAYYFYGINQFVFGLYDSVPFCTSLEVVAHEYTHAVEHSITGLIYEPVDKNAPFEPRYLCEAYADIMACCIEGSDWLMNDDILTDVDLQRDIADPTRLGKPETVGGDYYFPDYYLNGLTIEDYVRSKGARNLSELDKPHHNSTVVSHAAWQMLDSGAVDDLDQLALIWYRSLFLLSPTAGLTDCALAVTRAAIGCGLPESSVDAIKQIFLDSGMLDKNDLNLIGRVTDEESEPLPGCRVTLENYANREITYRTYTDDDGTFSFSKITRGDYTISYEAAGYKPYQKLVGFGRDSVLNARLAKVLSTEESGPMLEDCLLILDSRAYHVGTSLADFLDDGWLPMKYANYWIEPGNSHQLVLANSLNGAQVELLLANESDTVQPAKYCTFIGYMIDFQEHGWSREMKAGSYLFGDIPIDQSWAAIKNKYGEPLELGGLRIFSFNKFYSYSRDDVYGVVYEIAPGDVIRSIWVYKAGYTYKH